MYSFRTLHHLALILCVATLAGCSMQGARHYGGDQLYAGNGPIGKPHLNGDILGSYSSVSSDGGEDLSTVAQKYDLGYKELEDANPSINPNHLSSGSELLLPTAYILPPKQYRTGIVINIAELRLYYFDPDGNVETYPVALGKEGWHTPLGRTRIVKMKEAPSWRPPASIRQFHKEKYGDDIPDIIPPGPENPLGDYALYLSMPGYLIHGTAAPQTIGQLVSAGCIRMYNDDIGDLYSRVKVGTPVRIIYRPVRAGWRDGRLYLEAHRPVLHANANYAQHEPSPASVIQEALVGHQQVKIDQAAVNRILRERNGVPGQISKS